ncbi:class I SAM-dependent methyltransferase [Phyllobacterium sp. UNC302MFCol5.2]|uniref:class I SAM-dependent methyltransferase n=1 Tax=Phyllobacterium sp. UNC302MFCol5.2 TaxID=1449065 RepID=UPI000B1E86BE|nr:class I SAM-dependent methyltransferase [Phyllobacterium sp. UNC302MFCol5.2]
MPNTLKRLAMKIPAIARLREGRSAALAENARLAAGLKTAEDLVQLLRAQISRAQPTLDHLEDFKAYHIGRREAGFVAELDYPYFPRVMNWDLEAGNPWMTLIAARREDYKCLLASFCEFQPSLNRISLDEPADVEQPYWSNNWLPILDSISIYCFLAKNNPKLYLEVGSGNSTKFARRAVRDHGLQTKIISIDPMPRAEIDKICDEVVRAGLQDTDLSVFDRLQPGDITFIDNSHRSFQNSDVTVFFTKVLPSLKAGCIYGIHDIFLPRDYPDQWTDRYYNEQYLLMMYLLGGAMGDEIMLPVAYTVTEKDILSALNPLLNSGTLVGIRPIGGAFWMTKR